MCLASVSSLCFLFVIFLCNAVLRLFPLQILQQFPSAFEFNVDFLVRIAEHVNSQWQVFKCYFFASVSAAPFVIVSLFTFVSYIPRIKIS